jgi:Putative phage metallopeptidase
VANVQFRPADECEMIAEDIIMEHLPHLRLPGVRIEYVFRSDIPKSKGREVWGRARLIQGINAYLASPQIAKETGEAGASFFSIEFSSPVWLRLDAKAKRALVHHELLHCYATQDVDEETGELVLVLSLLPHDLEEFGKIVELYGMWKQDVAAFMTAAARGGQVEMVMG